MKRRLLSSAPVLALALVACHTSTTAKAAPTPSEQFPAATTPSESSPATTASAAAASLPQIGSRDRMTYTDGLTVSVLSATKFTPSTDAVGPVAGDATVLFSVRITNGSTTPYHAVVVSVTASAGPDGAQCAEIFQNGPPNLGDTFRGYISPGESQTVPFGFDVPMRDVNDLRVSVQPDPHYAEATFAGHLAPS